MMRERARQAAMAYHSSRFRSLSTNYLSRLTRDYAIRPESHEVQFLSATVREKPDSSVVIRNMLQTFSNFLHEQMGVRLVPESSQLNQVFLIELSSLGNPGEFRINVTDRSVTIQVGDDDGARDAIVHLIDLIGLRRAPILSKGEEIVRPTIQLRMGSVPFLGSMRDVALMGYNAVMIKPYADLHKVSLSTTLPEAKDLQDSSVLGLYIEQSREARRWGLRPYMHLTNRALFSPDHPIFSAHPGIKGPRFHVKGSRGHMLSTTHPAMKKFIAETIAGVFETVSDLLERV